MAPTRKRAVARSAAVAREPAPAAPDPTRGAVFARPGTRPLGVSVVAGFLWLVALVVAIGALAAIVGVSVEYYEGQLDAERNRGTNRTGVATVVSVVGVSVGFLVGASALVVLGAGNVGAQAWAWTVTVVGSILLLMAAVTVVGTGLFLILAGSNVVVRNAGWVLALAGGGAASALLWCGLYYRRPEVQRYFGRPGPAA